jgi:predicted TPR repeat methyltransferase
LFAEAKLTRKTAGQEGLENSYKLSTPDDNIAYYRGFAPTYDTDFAEQMGWAYPKAIADAYHKVAAGTDIPIADIGCGTGFVAAELKLPPAAIDGMDISPEMLDLARGKGLYRSLFQVDLTGPLAMIANGYGAVLSAGTFTHGHLGPGPLRGLLGIARSGGLFIIGVNQVHFEKQQFADALDAMEKEKKIGPVKIDEVKMYSRAGHAHSDDRALILQYKKV